MISYASLFMFPFFMYFVLKRLTEIRDILKGKKEHLNEITEKEKTD